MVAPTCPLKSATGFSKSENVKPLSSTSSQLLKYFISFPGLFVVNVDSRFVRPAKGTTVEPTKDTVEDDDLRADSRKCYGFPEGLTVETDVVIGWSSRWENQCHEGMQLSIYISDEEFCYAHSCL